jgi:hypothetical protein
MTTAVPQAQQKRGFFHMLGRLWDMGTVAIDALETSVEAAYDLALTAKAHTSNIRLSTEAELGADLRELQRVIALQEPVTL